MIKTIVFDLGGIYYKEISLANILSKKYKISLEKAEKFMKNYNGCATSSEDSYKFWEDFKKTFDVRDDIRIIRETIIASVKIDNDVVLLIRKLRSNGYELLFFSNSHIDFTPEIFLRNNIKKEFNDGLLSHEYPYYKPDIRFYEKLLSLTKSKPDEIVFIDDRESNLASAKRLGMNAILFKNRDDLIDALRKLSISI